MGISDAASDSRKVVQASEILAAIERGEPVEYDGVIVEGDLDLDGLDLSTKHIERTEDETRMADVLVPPRYVGLTEEAKVVDSSISITNSEIQGGVKFGNAIFRESVDFRGTNFIGGDAYFYWAQFSGDAYFSDAQFGGDTYFKGTQFGGDAHFSGTKFDDYARFSDAQFSGDADFWGAQFNGDARFWLARFSGDADFRWAQFSGDARFEIAQFSGDAHFEMAQFNRDAHFEMAQFNRDVPFSDAQFSGDARFSDARFSGDADFRWARFGGDACFSDAQFNGDVPFSDAQFGGDANFIGAQFGGDAHFWRTQFSGDADFRWAQFSSGGANFGGAKFSSAVCIRWEYVLDKKEHNYEFYSSLIETYKTLGWFVDAGNCYYQSRINLHQDLPLYYKSIDWILMVLYGYGVKPIRPLLWSFIFISVFGLFFWRLGGISPLNKGASPSLMDSISFSSAVFLSGTKLFVDKPEHCVRPKTSTRLATISRCMFTLERVLGAVLFFLFLLAVSDTLIS